MLTTDCSPHIKIIDTTLRISSEIVPFFSNSNCTVTISSNNSYHILLRLRKVVSHNEDDKLIIIDNEDIQRNFKDGGQNFTSLSNQFRLIFQTRSKINSLSFFVEIYLISKCNDIIVGNRGIINISSYIFHDEYLNCSAIIKSNDFHHKILLRYENKNLSKETINYLYLLQNGIETKSGNKEYLTFLTNSYVLKFLYIIDNSR